MKLTFFQILGIVAILLIIVSLTFGCGTTKNVVKEDMTLIVLLEKGKNGTYLEKNYSDYQPVNIKRANRTLNQYRVQFSCTTTEAKTLMQQLEDDPQVLKITSKNN